MQATRDDLMRVLTRYEAAVSEVEREGNEEYIPELQEARAALLDVLQQCRVQIEAS
jgi:hypothetical protein